MIQNHLYKMKSHAMLLTSDALSVQDVTYFEVIVPVGVTDEVLEQHGYSHIIEHLVTRSINAQLRADGWKGSYVLDFLEATTHAEYTRYAFSVEAGDVEIAQSIIDLIFSFPALSDADFSHELDVIAQELLESQDDPTYPIRKKALEELYPSSALGYDPAEMARPSSLEKLRPYWDEHYRIDHAIISVVGATEAWTSQADELKASIGATKKAAIAHRAPVQNRVAYVESQDNQAQIGVYAKLPWESLQDIVTIDMLTEILGAYLFSSLRETGLMYEVDVDNETHHGFAVVHIGGAFNGERVKDVHSHITEALESFISELTPDVIDHSIQDHIKRMHMDSHYPATHLDALGWYWNYTHQMVGLSGLEVCMRAVTSDALRGLAQKLIDGPRVTVFAGVAEELR
jgi:predicted Zn-dependent peptidase